MPAQRLIQGCFSWVGGAEPGHAGSSQQSVGFIKGRQHAFPAKPADDRHNAFARLRSTQALTATHSADNGGFLDDCSRQFGLVETCLAVQMLGKQIAKRMAHECLLLVH